MPKRFTFPKTRLLAITAIATLINALGGSRLARAAELPESDFPEGLATYMPKLRELGGRISLTHAASVQNPRSDGRRRAQIKYTVQSRSPKARSRWKLASISNSRR